MLVIFIILACGAALLITVMVMCNSSLTLESKIKEANVTLGAYNKDKNKIVIQITSTSDEPISLPEFGSRGEISLTLFVGTQAEDLVGTKKESETITIDGPDDWVRTKNRYEDNKLIMGFELPEKVFEKNEEKIITLKNFEPNTGEGKAKIEVRAEIDGYEPYSCELKVMKKESEFQICNFEADPPYIITEEDKKNFKLKWTTIKAKKVELYKNNIRYQTLEEGVKDEKGEIHFKNDEEYEFYKDKPSFTTVYKLVATDEADRSRKIEKELTVQFLQSGWHAVDFPRYGYPAVLFNMNQNQVKLYAIFIKNEKASLCSSTHPYAVWDLENEVVPEKMETSPGVCFDNKLWLLGGSSVYSNNFSNRICTYDTKSGHWNDQKVAWNFRMGHAAVVFKNRLYILGGIDVNGNTLNDVWSLGSDGNWQQHPDANWEPRCMFAATVFEDRIWIYGGAAEPFGDPMDDMWTSGDGEKWDRYQIIPKLAGDSIGKPISCTLQVVKGELNLMGFFRRDQTVRANICILNENQETWFVSEVGTPWDQQVQNTHRLLSVEYKGLVFLRSLNYEIHNNPTKLYLYLP